MGEAVIRREVQAVMHQSGGLVKAGTSHLLGTTSWFSTEREALEAARVSRIALGAWTAGYDVTVTLNERYKYEGPDG